MRSDAAHPKATKGEVMSEETGLISIPIEGWLHRNPYSLIIECAKYRDFENLLGITCVFHSDDFGKYLIFSEIHCCIPKFNTTKVYTFNTDTGKGKWRLPYTNTYP